MIGVVATLKIKEGSGADFEAIASQLVEKVNANDCLLYTSPSPRDRQKSRMPSSA